MRPCVRPRLRDCAPDDPRDERDRSLERELADPPLLLCREERERPSLPAERLELLLPELLLPELLLRELVLPELPDCRPRPDWRC